MHDSRPVHPRMPLTQLEPFEKECLDPVRNLWMDYMKIRQTKGPDESAHLARSGKAEESAR